MCENNQNPQTRIFFIGQTKSSTVEKSFGSSINLPEAKSSYMVSTTISTQCQKSYNQETKCTICEKTKSSTADNVNGASVIADEGKSSCMVATTEGKNCEKIVTLKDVPISTSVNKASFGLVMSRGESCIVSTASIMKPEAFSARYTSYINAVSTSCRLGLSELTRMVKVPVQIGYMRTRNFLFRMENYYRNLVNMIVHETENYVFDLIAEIDE
ncbi:uncharacterized protein LOC119687904 [Teleopsis dalmanni]|uniref:uncharacterized protein LOC119687904 n=1 Tax=Teleopsis dalmanni TaxID=139649 RepID=UPI0018CE16F2|nr:uncharacterized protein LOC119687904 [Teleopsis dalmanni]